jgi:hypothetical protein
LSFFFSAAVFFVSSRRLPRLFLLMRFNLCSSGHLVLAHMVVARLSNLELCLITVVLNHRRQPLWLTSLQFLVGLLLLSKLLLKLPNHLILHQQLPLLTRRLLPVSLPVNHILRLDNLDALLEVLLLLLKLIYLPNQLDVLRHQAPIDFLVLLVGLRKLCFELSHIVGQLLTLALELNRGILTIRGFLLDLFSNILLVQPDNSLLELLVVSDAVLSIVHLISKLTFFILLLFQLTG